MSLKDQIQEVKEELTQEEKFFESTVKAERFIKKYRGYIIAATVLIAVALIGFGANEVMNENRLESANSAYLALMEDENASKQLDILKENSDELYALYLFAKTQPIATKRYETKWLLDDLNTYKAASKSMSLDELRAYAMRPNAIYKELALYQSAYLLLKAGNNDEAKQQLEAISDESVLAKEANALRHMLN